ncbi:MAG TPA: manganese efflux pump MntP family protein [Bacilli bacterium]|nr:manganese efflux pump MntP family protein [Bacilli bacterium]HQA56127.1 manganese efflux pump MntP family protein [Bacilli bacterium]
MDLFIETLVAVAIIGVGLAMDAFAVSICDGITINRLTKGKATIIALTFGLMQGLMPLIGYLIGSLFYKYIESFDHWIAFGLLGFIGGKMLYEGIKSMKLCEVPVPKEFSYKKVLVQGVATSIDALMVGVTLCSMTMGLVVGGFDYSIFVEIGVIAVITFAICIVGILLGKVIYKLINCKYAIAEVIGGLILIGIGLKILIEHLVS